MGEYIDHLGGRRMGIAPEEDVDMQVQPKDGDTPEQRTGADAQARHTHRYHSGSSEPRSTQTSQGLLLQQPPQLQPQPHQGQQLADMTRLPTQASVGGPSRPLGQQSSQFPVFAPPGLGINVAAATASHQPRQDVASSSARVDALKRGRDDGTADTDGTANTQKKGRHGELADARGLGDVGMANVYAQASGAGASASHRAASLQTSGVQPSLGGSWGSQGQTGAGSALPPTPARIYASAKKVYKTAVGEVVLTDDIIRAVLGWLDRTNEDTESIRVALDKLLSGAKAFHEFHAVKQGTPCMGRTWRDHVDTMVAAAPEA